MTSLGPGPEERDELVDALARGGCVAPDLEAEELIAAAQEGGGDIQDLLARRLGGEPLAWITGSILFCGLQLRVDRGVFVPRPRTELLATRGASLLPVRGIAVDLCTGCGAVAAVLGATRPEATVLATDVDAIAVNCARSNGVHALVGDLDQPLPAGLEGHVDLLTAVVPYVPTEELHLLPRDVLANEPRAALDGGPRGTAFLLRVVDAAARWLAPTGTLLVELGGDQATDVAAGLKKVGLSQIAVHLDDEGQARVLEARS